MNLSDIIDRTATPEPWAEGEKIPWNDPAFSKRMLREHLTQEHDAASRRFAVIDRHVAWIHEQVLGGRVARILDLACGPGLYTGRLARLGHECGGIDFAPASIAYARAEAAAESLACVYELADLRRADFGEGFDLVMFINGELNVFRRNEAKLILSKAYAALVEGGQLLLEQHTFEAIRALGDSPSTWYSSAGGLFSAEPHLQLYESMWNEAEKVVIQRYYVIDSAGNVTPHASTMPAYTNDEYQALLESCGFGDVTFSASLTGDDDGATPGYLVITARKA